MYYLPSYERTFNSIQVKKRIGVNPDSFTNLDMLNYLRVYPVKDTYLSPNIQYFYDVTVDYQITGNFAYRTYLTSVKSIDEVKVGAKTVLRNKFISDLSSVNADDVDDLYTQYESALNIINATTNSSALIDTYIYF